MAEGVSTTIKRRLNNSYRCGYCLQYFNKLEDPRTLPCLHVYCMMLTVGELQYTKCIGTYWLGYYFLTSII